MIKYEMFKTKQQIAKEYVNAILTVSSVILVTGLDLMGIMSISDSIPVAVIFNTFYRLTL